MELWIKLNKLLEDPFARSCVTEGILTILLLLIVVMFALGWKPKLTRKRVLLAGLFLLITNSGILWMNQERSMDAYGPAFWFIIIPLLTLLDRGENRITAGGMLSITFWVLFFLETGLLISNLAIFLTAAIILTMSFQSWRNPKEEGFPKTKIVHWNWLIGVFAFFLLLTSLMMACGWEKVLTTRYLTETRWMLPIIAALFFLVKAIPEELIFRGVLQGALKDKIGFRSALISSALFYGLTTLNNPAPWAFPNWHAVINATLLGLGCGIVYNRTKSLAISAVVNASVSFTWFVLLAKGGY